MICEYLFEGKAKAITGERLAELLELKDVRTVRHLIEQERRAGKPICASCDSERPGYYLASDAEEWEVYTNSLARRQRELTRTLDACLDTLDRMSGQDKISGW